MKSKTTKYVISGLLLCYFGLKTDNFEIFYNGIALTLGVGAFFMAFIEYKKNKVK